MPVDALTIGAVATAAGGLLGVGLTKGIDAYVKWRKTNYEIASAECHEEDDRADSWAKMMIATLQEDMKKLRGEMVTLRTEHLQCEKMQSELKAEIAYLRRQVNN